MSKSRDFSLKIVSLQDPLYFSVTVQIVHGAFIPQAHEFVDTVSLDVRFPERGEFGTNKIFFAAVEFNGEFLPPLNAIDPDDAMYSM